MKPAPQELFCELCDGPATPDDWSPPAGQLICPACLEALAEERTCISEMIEVHHGTY